jgi:hypothetical protein
MFALANMANIDATVAVWQAKNFHGRVSLPVRGERWHTHGKQNRRDDCRHAAHPTLEKERLGPRVKDCGTDVGL